MLGDSKMPDEDTEILVSSKNISDIKEEIFKLFPNLREYTDSCTLEREFGKNEECGTNRVFFNISSLKDIEIEIIYEKC